MWHGIGITDSLNGIFDPSVAGVGTFTIVHTIGCGSDSTVITVNNTGPCAYLYVCRLPNGDLSVLTGTPPFTWQKYNHALSYVITNQTQCLACGYSWTFGSCRNGTIPVSLCNSPASWTTFASGTYVTPLINDTIRVIDSNNVELIIFNPATLDICLVGNLEHNQSISEFYLYPNPANDILTIETPQKGSQIEILSIHGQLLLKQELKQAKTEIDISAFAKGVYAVRISNGEKVGVKKLVKE